MRATRHPRPKAPSKAPMIRLFSLLALTITLLAPPLHAQCNGENLFSTMDPDRLAAITAAADAVPFPRGNHWRATRGDEVVLKHNRSGAPLKVRHLKPPRLDRPIHSTATANDPGP